MYIQIAVFCCIYAALQGPRRSQKMRYGRTRGGVSRMRTAFKVMLSPFFSSLLRNERGIGQSDMRSVIDRIIGGNRKQVNGCSVRARREVDGN